MSNMWQRIGAVAPGGTVLDIAVDIDQRLWLSTGAGIFYTENGAWRALRRGRPLAQVNALAWAEKIFLAGGGDGQIVYSTDRGETWYRSQTGPVSQPITWLNPSPVFHLDNMVLAGTDGAGVLRSSDGGRSWRPANAGLQDLSIIALATAPKEAWERQAVVFAAASRGIYRSINGGRNWTKPEAGLEELTVQAMAVSPNFARDGQVFAATETDGLFRSKDRGKSWHRWGEGLAVPDGFPALNCLWLHPDFASQPVGLMGTSDGRILRSADGGATWTEVTVAGSPVFYLAGDRERLYAGLHEQGLLVSDDQGQTWQPETNLVARALTRLAAGYGSHLFAFGSMEGAWGSNDAGQTWQRILAPAEHAVLALAASPQVGRPCLLAGTTNGLLRSEDEGRSWQPVLETGEVMSLAFSAHFADNGRAWAGTSAGEVLVSEDGGLNWTIRRGPRPEQPLISLAVSPISAGLQERRNVATGPDGGPVTDILAAATYNPRTQQVTLWRSINGGKKWTQWMQVAASWPAAQLCLADQAIACVGSRCWQATGAGWQRSLEMDQPIIRLERLPDLAGVLLITSDQVLHSLDGAAWTRVNEGLAGEPLLDLAVLHRPGDEGAMAYILTAGGLIWRRPV